jgi:protein phosphatase
MTPPSTSSFTRPSDTHHRRTRTQPRQRVRPLPLSVVERAALSDTGLRREHNEDSFMVAERMFAVADGVGGGRAGEVASSVAVEALRIGAHRAFEADDLERLAQRAAGAVHAKGLADPEFAGMATTLTSALVAGDRVEVAHAGDSRLYRLRGGTLECLTDDHSFVSQMLREGLLTEEQAAVHPMRSMITRALGRDPDVDFAKRSIEAAAGDIFLLCSDGLTGMLPDGQIETIVRDSSSLDDAALRLIRQANAAGGRDNITVVLFRLGAGAPAALAA